MPVFKYNSTTLINSYLGTVLNITGALKTALFKKKTWTCLLSNYWLLHSFDWALVVTELKWYKMTRVIQELCEPVCWIQWAGYGIGCILDLWAPFVGLPGLEHLVF